MKIQIDFSAELSLPQAMPAMLQIEAATLPHKAQTVESSTLRIEPETSSELITDLYGNSCRRLLLPAGDVRVGYQGVVVITDARLPLLNPVELDALHLPAETLIYLLPSRYCPSDRMVHMAQDLFGRSTQGFARVQSICNWINEHIYYQYGASNASTSALDTIIDRAGVCRDFAHLAISFCRALNIPARYVSGYCLGLKPPDFHAYFEAYLDGRWVAFDATERQPRPALIQIATGRDAADCAWSTFFGIGFTKWMNVEVKEAGS